MKKIITANLKEIEWLEKEGHVAKEVNGDMKGFEVEEDVVIPNFYEKKSEIKEEKKIEVSEKSTQEINGNGIVKDKKKLKKEKTKKK